VNAYEKVRALVGEGESLDLPCFRCKRMFRPSVEHLKQLVETARHPESFRKRLPKHCPACHAKTNGDNQR
jgi:hypothetical protein